MIRIDSDTWANLEKSNPVGEKYIARRGLPELTDRLLCAIDSSRTRHLLVTLKPDEDELHDDMSRGVAVDTLELVVQGQSAARYIDIKCRDASGHSILDSMGGEIAEELRDSKRLAAEIVQQVLAKWRRFWGHVPQQLMSHEEQLGMFAEIWFLSKWLIPRLGSDSVFFWRGPWRSRHDFEWTDKSVEVKATTNSRGRIYIINGIRQLENPENGPLYLFSVLLREERGAINNLPGLVETCRELLKNKPDALTHFEDGLAKAGYSPAQEDEYSHLHLAILETVLFSVDQNFPRIIASSFPDGLPIGIEKIDYEINLNTFNHLIVASEPDQAPFNAE